MKVIMQGRVDLNRIGGGDKIQIENTAKELCKLGVEVDINTDLNKDISKYDIVHIFQLDWHAENYLYARLAKRFNKPVVLSPIHHSVKEVKKYDDTYTFGWRRLSKLLFKDQYTRDTLKNIYRSMVYFPKIKPTLHSLFLGLKNLHKKTLEMSDIVLVQTGLEAHDLKETYNVDFKWLKLPNGVGRHFLKEHSQTNPLAVKDYILCSGRIEPRKNQLKIIEAVDNLRKKHNLNVSLVILGEKNTGRHKEYTMRFDAALKKYKWLIHVPKVPYENVPVYYKFAKVCVSASWFETTGLTSLEALFCKTNAVAAGERAEEFLGGLASYCQPDDVESIEKAIAKEYFAPRPTLPSDMINEYTWENVAKKTLEVYTSVIASKAKQSEKESK